MQRSSSTWCLARRKRGEGIHRSASMSNLSDEPQAFDYNECVNYSYAEFLLRVNCPLCSKTQSNKSELMKHLECDCTKQKKIKKRPQLAVFKILPNNVIKCGICKSREFATIETYFYHLKNEHSAGDLPVKNHTTQSVYCVPCKMQVPNNLIQLELHLKNDFHLRKRKAALNGQQLRAEFATTCIFSFFHGKKMFKCFECFPPVFISTPLDLIDHFRTENHSRSDDLVGMRSIHCSFCEINFSIYEVGYHFTSAVHLQKEENMPEVDSYETCPFCGFSSDSIPELTEHLTVTCPEVKREKECSSKVVAPKPLTTNVEEVIEHLTITYPEVKREKECSSKVVAPKPLTTNVEEVIEHLTITYPEVKREKECSSKVVAPKPEATKVEEAAQGGKEKHKINKKHSILVKDDVDIVSLIKVLKKIGDIIFVCPYDEEHIVIEFEKEPPIEEIYLIRQLVRINGKKINLMFL